MNLEFLEEIARRFGAKITIREVGAINCGPMGWFTGCPTDKPPLQPGCVGPMPRTLDIVTEPIDIQLRENCNLPPHDRILPHDPELYAAFNWLLPKILPQPAYYCMIYFRAGISRAGDPLRELVPVPVYTSLMPQ